MRKFLLTAVLIGGALFTLPGTASAAVGCPTPKPGSVACLEGPPPSTPHHFCGWDREPHYNTRWGYDDPSLGRRG